MARYRSKDETDLTWNRIRRRITRELDTQIYDWREDALDKLLTEAWTRYAKSLEVGVMPEIESGYAEWVTKALDEGVKPNVEVG